MNPTFPVNRTSGISLKHLIKNTSHSIVLCITFFFLLLLKMLKRTIYLHEIVSSSNIKCKQYKILIHHAMPHQQWKNKKIISFLADSCKAIIVCNIQSTHQLRKNLALPHPNLFSFFFFVDRCIIYYHHEHECLLLSIRQIKQLTVVFSKNFLFSANNKITSFM